MSIINKKNLVFIGYRGAGKSHLSRNVAKKLKYKFIQTDFEITKNFGQSVNDIITDFGWQKFREEEQKTLKHFLGEVDTVFDFGGGAIQHEKIMAQFKKTSVFVFIKAKLSTLIKRIKLSSHRPQLTEQALEKEVETTLDERLPLYQKYADFNISNDISFNPKLLEEKVEEITTQYHHFRK